MQLSPCGGKYAKPGALLWNHIWEDWEMWVHVQTLSGSLHSWKLGCLLRTYAFLSRLKNSLLASICKTWLEAMEFIQEYLPAEKKEAC